MATSVDPLPFADPFPPAPVAGGHRRARPLASVVRLLLVLLGRRGPDRTV